MTILTAYSTSSDGYVQHNHAVYATCQGAATGTSASAAFDYCLVGNWVDGNYYITRTFLYFDTSSIPDTAVVSAATLGIYGDAGDGQDEDDAGHSDILLYEGTQADPATTADYDSFNAVALTDDDSPWEYPLATDDYNTVTLNSAGLGVINKTGTTKFCLRLSGDVDTSTPAGLNYVYLWANEKGAGYYPKLVITYALPAPPADGDLISPSIIRKS